MNVPSTAASAHSSSSSRRTSRQARTRVRTTVADERRPVLQHQAFVASRISLRRAGARCVTLRRALATIGRSALSRSSSSISTAPSSTPAGSSSPRCATRPRPCSAASYTDAELMANVGGPGLEAQMEALAPGPRRRARARLPRAQRAAARRARGFARHRGRARARCGTRAAGSASSPPSAARPSTSRSRGCRSRTSSTPSSAATRPSSTSRDPAPLLLALERLGATAGRRPRTSATRRSTCRPREPAGLYAIGVTWGRIHDRDALGDADVVVDTAEELLAVL